MSPAVITLQFDPTVDLGGRLVRWETIALAGVILLSLILAAWLAGRANRAPRAAIAAESNGAAPATATNGVLLRDDLLYMVIGAIPGAVIGGRLLYALDFYDYYFRVTAPSALLDPSHGTLSLLGAVLGGTITAAYVGWLIGAPLRRWMDVAIVPLLVGIGLGKFATLLGGGGQGAISDVPWAVAFAGGGPWRSLGADLPAHPSQAYEGSWALAGILVVGLFALPLVWRAMPARLRQRPRMERDPGTTPPPDGTVEVPPRARRGAPGFLFAVGLAWWLLGRIAVGFTWRDDHVLGALNAEQLAGFTVLLALALWLVVALRPRRKADD